MFPCVVGYAEEFVVSGVVKPGEVFERVCDVSVCLWWCGAPWCCGRSARVVGGVGRWGFVSRLCCASSVVIPSTMPLAIAEAFLSGVKGPLTFPAPSATKVGCGLAFLLVGVGLYVAGLVRSGVSG